MSMDWFYSKKTETYSSYSQGVLPGRVSESESESYQDDMTTTPADIMFI